MSSPDLGERVCGVIAHEFAIARPDVSLDARLRADLDLDSLDVVALGARLEESFEIELEDETLGALESVADVLRLVEARLAERTARPAERAAPPAERTG